MLNLMIIYIQAINIFLLRVVFIAKNANEINFITVIYIQLSKRINLTKCF